MRLNAIIPFVARETSKARRRRRHSAVIVRDDERILSFESRVRVLVISDGKKLVPVLGQSGACLRVRGRAFETFIRKISVSNCYVSITQHNLRRTISLCNVVRLRACRIFSRGESKSYCRKYRSRDRSGIIIEDRETMAKISEISK